MFPHSNNPLSSSTFQGSEKSLLTNVPNNRLSRIPVDSRSSQLSNFPSLGPGPVSNNSIGQPVYYSPILPPNGITPSLPLSNSSGPGIPSSSSSSSSNNPYYPSNTSYYSSSNIPPGYPSSTLMAHPTKILTPSSSNASLQSSSVPNYQSNGLYSHSSQSVIQTPLPSFSNNFLPNGNRPQGLPIHNNPPPNGNQPPGLPIHNNPSSNGIRPLGLPIHNNPPPNGMHPSLLTPTTTTNNNFPNNRPPSESRPPLHNFPNNPPPSNGSHPSCINFSNNRPPSESRPPLHNFPNNPPPPNESHSSFVTTSTTTNNNFPKYPPPSESRPHYSSLQNNSKQSPYIHFPNVPPSTPNLENNQKNNYNTTAEQRSSSGYSSTIISQRGGGMGGYPSYKMSSNQGEGSLNSSMAGLSLSQGCEALDLLANRHILPQQPLDFPKPRLHVTSWNDANCSPELFRCTLTKIPENEGILKKSRLPLGVLIHPFKDLSYLPVIQCANIVRCRHCRTYINPFVSFVDQRRWKCNICFRVNDLPEEFLYDPLSKSYGDPSRRPECKSATIEFIAPSEYMVRPPQAAVYIFLLDISRQAYESGYLQSFCDILLEELDRLPGDGRTQIGFITYDRNVHFYSLPEGAIQPSRLSVCDIEDMFLPSPNDLLVNLNECKELIKQLLKEMPSMSNETCETESALGAALQAAFKLASPSGGRISIFQTVLPNIGPGRLINRDNKENKESTILGPSTDFYKKIALDCSGQQISVDLFALGSQYLDLATLSGISKFSGGQISYFPGFHRRQNPSVVAKFEGIFRRYLTRKIGFEAVMRVRCTRGLSLHTFYGNFFVRSTDLLSLPNVNPDSGFGIQVSIEDDLRDCREVSFQAALLYTSSKGERRIRVHTLCIPTTASIIDVINGADQEVIIGMLAKFASERAISDSISDSKAGLVISTLDALETYNLYSSLSSPSGLILSRSLCLLPLYILATMKSSGFRPGTKADSRIFCFTQLNSLPLSQLMKYIYPRLYRVDNISEAPCFKQDDDDDENEEDEDEDEEDGEIPQLPQLQLSYEHVSSTGVYLMDVGDTYIIYIGRAVHQMILEQFFGVASLQDIDENKIIELPERQNINSEKLRNFISYLNLSKPYPSSIRIIREDGKSRHLFLENFVEDRGENSFSYFEFLQHLKKEMKH